LSASTTVTFTQEAAGRLRRRGTQHELQLAAIIDAEIDAGSPRVGGTFPVLSGNGPSVTTGAPIPSCVTSFAASGPVSPSAPTSSPLAASSSWIAIMWAPDALMSSGDHSLGRRESEPWFMSSMYFIA
jgi:hypothetical protein